MPNTQEYRKAKLIASEMMDYFFNYWVKDLRVDIIFEAKEVVIRLTAAMSEEPADIEELMDQLQKPRQYEVEEYYEDLLGIREDQVNAEIIAAMIDEAAYSFATNCFQLELTRYLT
ncbi:MULTISPECIES: hypothetical protein [Aerococcus]|nr:MULTISPECIES: hypothetical protein [Aerococcus]MDK6369307.1 hypothetical protein [Aerococcus sp. UMB9870]MDK6679131.1 hypothetical protein [Aerococcus sp. UMB8608]MDK6687184.1 hypothetical protein [Aerococcus sp. UMB8623]MDK6941140.1 hypothetical protein [Aerococcus sp. UMB8487]OFK13521.1 hypothetical protein HMPREF2829_05695 [Aerococcus sp. HMSC072A12]